MSTEFFIIYDIATGQERMRGHGDAGITDLQRPPEGMAAVTLPEAAWTGPLGEVSVDTMRAALWERVKLRRDAKINGGAPTPVGAVDSDDLSRTNITGAVVAAILAQAAGAPYSVDWTLADNSVETLDASQVIAMGIAVMQHVNACHQSARNLRNQIEGAVTIEALLKIDTIAGWP